MASSIDISFEVQALDGGQGNRGVVNIIYNNGSPITLFERLTLNVPTTRYFQEVAWVSGQETALNAQQAQNFATAFNRDYKNVGGTKNLSASVTGNVVTISSKVGTFDTGGSYTGDILIVDISAPNNNTTPSGLLTTVTQSETVGDCSTIEYSATVSAGSPFYSLTVNGQVFNSMWSGALETFNLNRGVLNSVVFSDINGLTSNRIILAPKTLEVGEFDIIERQFDSFSDLTVEINTQIAGITGYTYAISESNGDNRTALQTSNVFTGIVPGSYRVYVQDNFGCEISKVIVVTELEDALVDVVDDYFLIPKANSIAFYDGTIEKVNIKYLFRQQWKPKDFITTQFKSSFPYHNLTLKHQDGSKQSVNFLLIQENLGFIEKVDCTVFDYESSRAVYFDAGNEYHPNTETILGTSPYSNFLPSWAVVGRTVVLDDIGSTIIKSTGFDTVRQKYFFVTALPATGSATEISSRVQATYNIHNYNLYESVFDMSDITEDSYFEYEYGYSETEIVGSRCSVLQKPLEENCKTLRMEWYDSKNRGNMVFQSGIKGYMNIVGDFYKTPNTDAELALGDQGATSLRQTARIGWKLELDLMPPEIWEKLNIISGVQFFMVDGILLKRSNSTAIARIGETNFRTFEAEFELGINELGIVSDETVLSTSTGVLGGGSTGKTGALAAWDGKTRLITDDGELFVEVGGNLIEIP